jgi:hypothetical protein
MWQRYHSVFVQLLQRYEVGVVFFQAGVDDTSPYNDDIGCSSSTVSMKASKSRADISVDSSFPEGVCGSRQEKLDVVG